MRRARCPAEELAVHECMIPVLKNSRKDLLSSSTSIMFVNKSFGLSFLDLLHSRSVSCSSSFYFEKSISRML
jgi:hypothetical protein